jgi:lysozyme
MPAQTIREYLVGIGFSFDEEQIRKFHGFLDKAEKQFKEFAKVGTAAAVELAAVILKVSSSMEDLWFAAQKAGTSVTSLRSIRAAAETVGLGADTATAAIQAMASALRSNPGFHAFFQQLGIHEVSDNTQNFIHLIEKLRQLSSQGAGGHAIATQIAGMFGMDEQTLTLFEKNLPELLKAQQEIQERLAKGGIASDAQAQQFHQFAEDVRKLEQSVGVLTTQFAYGLLPYARELVHYMQYIVDLALKLDKETHGASTMAGGIAATVGTAVAGKALMASLLQKILGGGAAAEGGAAAAGAGLGGLAVGGLATLDIGLGIFDAIKLKQLLQSYKESGSFDWITDFYRKHVQDPHAMGMVDPNFTAREEGLRLQTYADAGGQSIGFGHRIQAGEDFSGGITRAQAIELFTKDMSQVIDTINRLVKVHLGGNQLTALADLVYNIGGGAFAQSNLLKDLNAGDLRDAAEQFLQFNKERLNGVLVQNDALTSRRIADRDLFNKPDVSISQNNTIHVTGGDAEANAKAVGEQQSRVNGDMLRNLQNAVQ